MLKPLLFHARGQRTRAQFPALRGNACSLPGLYDTSATLPGNEKLFRMSRGSSPDAAWLEIPP